MMNKGRTSIFLRNFVKNPVAICLFLLLIGTLRFIGLPTLTFGYDFCLVAAPLLIAVIVSAKAKSTPFQAGDFLIVLMYIWINVSAIMNRTSMDSTLQFHVLFILYCVLRQRGHYLTERLFAKCFGLISIILLVQFTVIKLVYHQLSYTAHGALDNEVFLAIYLAVVLPFIFRLFKSRYWAVTVALFLLSVIGYYSRTALIATCVSAIMYTILLHSNRKQMLLLISGIFILTLWLVSLNTASIQGRFLIWKIAFLSIDWQILLIGKGPNYVYDHFLDLQANYFKNERPLTEQLLAGEVHTTFNEYLRLLIEYGIVGLSLGIAFIIGVYQQILRNVQKNAYLFISLTTFLIISFFSYPLSSLTIWVVLIMIYTAIPWQETVNITRKEAEQRKFRLSYLIVASLILIGFLSLRKFQAVQEWERLKLANYQRYNEQLFLTKADALLPDLKNEIKFTQDYAKSLYNMGFYEKALGIVDLSSKQYSNLSVNLLKASIYEELGKDEQAEKQYQYCINMLPKAFSARYLLFNLYNKMGNRDKAKEIARNIHAFPEKVFNSDVKMIKEEVNKFLVKID